jgi:hypothetical protein
MCGKKDKLDLQDDDEYRIKQLRHFHILWSSYSVAAGWFADVSKNVAV